jgi:hypothetical protein
MSGIQILLVTVFVFTAVYFVVKLRRFLFDIIFLILLASAAVVFVMFPEFTSKIANRLGVGRGTDLVLYLCIVSFWFVILKLYIKLRAIEQKMTDMIREKAIEHAKEPE